MPLRCGSRFRRTAIGLPVRAGVGSGRRLPLIRARTTRPRTSLALIWATTGSGRVLALLHLSVRAVGLPVSRSQGNFELDDLIPLRISTIALGNGKKLTEPTTRILGG